MGKQFDLMQMPPLHISSEAQLGQVKVPPQLSLNVPQSVEAPFWHVFFTQLEPPTHILVWQVHPVCVQVPQSTLRPQPSPIVPQ